MAKLFPQLLEQAQSRGNLSKCLVTLFNIGLQRAHLLIGRPIICIHCISAVSMLITHVKLSN